MLSWLRYQYRLYRLHKEGRNLQKYHEQAYDQAVKQHAPKHELDRLVVSFADDLQIHHDRIGVLQTEYLVSLAEKYLIPVPEGSLPLDERGNDKWRTVKKGAILYLNSDGYESCGSLFARIAENALSLSAHGSPPSPD
jgi:hypothetical protein